MVENEQKAEISKVEEKPKKKKGRPPFEPDEETLNKVKGYASRGLNNKQIAECLGICYETLRVAKKKYSAFTAAIVEGKAFGAMTITNSLFTLAESGDIKAIKYYLSNQHKEEWQEKPEITADISAKITLVVDNQDLDA